MAFPQSFMDELTARSDIVDVVGSYVQLTRKGSNLFGLCPFHSEKTGSFSVSPDKQIYYCFGCKKGGGVVNFIMDIENLPFPDAVRFLAKRAGMEVPDEEGDREAGRRRQRLLDLNRDGADFTTSFFSSRRVGPFRTIWTGGRSKSLPPSNSAWAPRWTPGTYCSPP